MDQVNAQAIQSKAEQTTFTFNTHYRKQLNKHSGIVRTGILFNS